MEKKKRIIAWMQGAVLLLLLCLLLVIPSAAEETETASEPLPKIRIGLYWGETELDGANLLNDVGSGYDFGYFDADNEFVALAHTEETAISMLKDWSLYYVGGQYTSEKPETEVPVVGCYHIRLDACESAETAAEAASVYEDGYIGYMDGVWYPFAGSYTSLEQAETAAAERGIPGTAMTGSNRCVTVVATKTQKVLFQYDCGTETTLGVMPCASETGERPITWFKGREYYGGFRYTRLNGGSLTVVNILDLDDYVCGVIPYEMSPSWPLEALKAQAVAARTYAMENMGRHRSYGFDLCGTVDCQAYLGVWKGAEVCEQAVRETSGECITYDGEYINAVYASSDGGATEDSEKVFQEVLPYLRGKIDPYESYVNTGYDSWEMIYTAEQITDILQSKGYRCSDIVSITPTYTKLGNIYSLKFTDSRGVNWTFSRERAGSILYSTKYDKSTKSQRFTVTDADGKQANAVYINSPETPVNGEESVYVLSGSGTVQALNTDGAVTVLSAAGRETISWNGSGETIRAQRYRFSGSGFGHNLGMSQYGAKAMAELGMNYKEILHFYYTGVEIG